jgi:hypothetical protein
MRRAKSDGLRPEVRKLRDQIERWRKTRTKRTRMPEKLWALAAALGRAQGVYRTSQDLGISYDRLRVRVEQSGHGIASRGGRPRVRKAAVKLQPKFVELNAMPTPVAAIGSDSTLVEVEDAAGSKLTIRLGDTSPVDVSSVLAAFRGEGRRRRRR